METSFFWFGVFSGSFGVRSIVLCKCSGKYILSGPFASLISSLINIISLLLTTFDWTKVQGIAPRSHTGRPRTCLIIIIISISIIINIIITSDNEVGEVLFSLLFVCLFVCL